MKTLHQKNTNSSSPLRTQNAESHEDAGAPLQAFQLRHISRRFFSFFSEFDYSFPDANQRERSRRLASTEVNPLAASPAPVDIRDFSLRFRTLAAAMALVFAIDILLAPIGPGFFSAPLFAQPADFSSLNQGITQRLENYFQKAEDEDESGAWDAVVEEGAELLRMEWEYQADRLIEAETAIGAATQAELEAERDTAFAAFEAELEARVEERRGQWRARIAAGALDDLIGDIDRDAMAQLVEDASALVFTDAQDATERVNLWDTTASVPAATLKATWEAELDARVLAAQAAGAALTGAERDAFFAEIERERRAIESQYDLQESLILETSRRDFVREANAGDDLDRALAQTTDPQEMAKLLVEKTRLRISQGDTALGDTTFSGVDPAVIFTGGDYQAQVEQALSAVQRAVRSLRADVPV